MKKILGIFVAIVILMVSSVIFQMTKAILRASEFGEKLYPSIGKFAFFIEAIIGALPLIIGIWLVKLSWRKITYKEPEKIDNNSISSLTKAVLNHAKDVASEVKPMVEKYKENHASAKTIDEEQNITTVDNMNEDEIYEKVMLEIEQDKKVKSAWAKALALSEGDKSKETSLYINLRVNDIIEQKKKDIHNIELEKQKIQAHRDTEIWLDSETGLMWEMKTEENISHRYVWSKENVAQAQNSELLTDDVKDAFSYADKLNGNLFAGYDDWRVPTKEELKTILTYKKSKNKGFEDKYYFIKEPLSRNSSSYYWSSTTVKYFENLAEFVTFDYGNEGDRYKGNHYYVRCVRAGQ